MRLSWEDLRCDFAYSDRLARRAGLIGSSLEERVPQGVCHREASIALKPGTPARLRRFYTLCHPFLAEAPPFVLRHLSGVAAMRLALGAPADPGVWAVDLDPVHPTVAPDAYWKRGREVYAVEYDIQYGFSLVREKLFGLAQGYDGVFWGVPDPLRQRAVKRVVPPELRDRVEVIVAPW